MKKHILLLLGLLFSSISYEMKSVAVPQQQQLNRAFYITMAIAPFFYYAYTKNPVVKPPKEYTLDLNDSMFWSSKNAWALFDQGFIGQGSKAKAHPINPSLSESPECLPSGLIGHTLAYLKSAKSAAGSLSIIYVLLKFPSFIGCLEAFK